MVGACLIGPFEHFGSAAGVEGEQLDGECRNALDGLGDGVGDVVQFEIEKDLVAAVGDFANEVGAVSSEELEADFHPLEGVAEAVEHGEGFFARFEIECEDELARLLGHVRRLGRHNRSWQSAKVENFMALADGCGLDCGIDGFVDSTFTR